MMLRRFAVIGCLLVAIGTVVVAWSWFPWEFSPNYKIHVATGLLGTDGQKFVATFKRELSVERPRFRLDSTAYASLQESTEAFQNGKSDLIVLRSDHPAAATGGTIIIIKRMSLVVMTTANSPITTVKDLVGKKIAVLNATLNDEPLLRTVVQFYGLKPEDIIEANLAEFGTVLRNKQVAAFIAIGPPGPGEICDAVKAIVKLTKKPPKFIDIEEAHAIAEQNPVYEEGEISKGAFLTGPSIPDDDITTVAYTVRLVAKNSMLNTVASELTRLLLATKAKLAATLPRVAQIEVPDTDKKGILPVHPGAAAFIDGEQENFFEDALNLLFFFSIAGGLIGSFSVTISGLWRRHRPNEVHKKLTRLSAMMWDVKSASPDQLETLEGELDAMSTWLLEQAIREQITSVRISGAVLMISQIRLLIERRRKVA